MRIYAVADIHGKNDRLNTIGRAIDTYRPDVLVLAGDITGRRDSLHFINQINALSIPVLAIRGNSDPKKIERLIEASPTISSLHLKRVTIEGVPFIGIGGTLPLPFHSRLCLRERHRIRHLESLTTRDSVLVVHPPPYGSLDEVFGWFHAGCGALASFISRVQPRVVICGHIHERRGTTTIGDSYIVNCSIGRGGAGTLIDCHPTKIETVELALPCV